MHLSFFLYSILDQLLFNLSSKKFQVKSWELIKNRVYEREKERELYFLYFIFFTLYGESIYCSNIPTR